MRTTKDLESISLYSRLLY